MPAMRVRGHESVAWWQSLIWNDVALRAHLRGFEHSFDQFDLIGVEMSRGDLDRPWVTGSPI